MEYKEELENDLIAVDENDELVEEDVFVEYVLKNVKYLCQLCFFSWQGGENMIQEEASGGGACRHGVHA